MSMSHGRAYEYPDHRYYEEALPVSEALPVERAAFIRKTYLHLAFAILGLVLLEAGLILVITSAAAEGRVLSIMWGTRFSWLVVLGAFMLVSFLADYWARADSPRPMQYAGLCLYVTAMSIILLPLLLAATILDPITIPKAAIMTLAVFAGLSTAALMTRKDFSFLGPILCVGFSLSLGLIVVAILFGLELGTWFALGMVALLCASVLYQTSNMVHHYRTDQYVAASLGLFASVATMFWYILLLFLDRR